MEKITNDTDYQHLMQRIDVLMNKGSKNVSQNELEEIRKMALSAQEYESKRYVIEAPTTLSGMIEMKMFEMGLKQKSLAEKLNISEAKLSLILNGKQKPDIEFLKSVYSELHIAADFILEHA
jgi:HTH-type transcriptional regulator/antitoxin HigA